ncbi:carbohydrate ABC transporter permease [Leadbettera azotonutricia]|uniref:Sugar transport system n=1 Tax=Leadbettera azotonutricia (strain ATCC BAA-888 / DSM 13862 / ZAS-9) TaxID=545695 RepID=F5Y8A0_LEAAZ|nr:sugar ABC transporter permease [Leadbettera azotonutricia]AEF80702.1 sugar transport system [Leadbettera azotonutricia ZAS-9]
MDSKKKEALAATCFLAPNIVGFMAFTIGPIIASLYFSLTEWNLITSPKWVGFANFKFLFKDSRFIQTVTNTFVYTVATVPCGIAIALIFALLLNTKIKGVTLFRAIFFIPTIATMVGVAMLWRWLLQDDIGLIYYLLSLVNIKAPHFLSSTEWALFSVSLVSIWKGLGYNIVLLLAGLQGIDPTYYEVARMDGATRLQQLKNITLPLLSPTLFFVIIMGTISSFQVFDQTFILTKGGPAYSTTTIVYYIYLQGFQTMRMGVACASSVLLFIVIMAITLVQWRAQRKWVNY